MLLTAIISCFLHLWLLPFEFSRLKLPSKEISHKEDGISNIQNSPFRICCKDDCNGQPKPPKTHHCSVCKVCRVGYDHHCHFAGHSALYDFRLLMTIGWNLHYICQYESVSLDPMAHSYSCDPQPDSNLVTFMVTLQAGLSHITH